MRPDDGGPPIMEPCLLCGGRGFVLVPNYGAEAARVTHYDRYQCSNCKGAKHVPAGTQAAFWETEDE